MILSSPAFLNLGSIPTKYTCQGEGIHPPLEIHDVPEDTASLALLVDDPDAPNGTYTHWMVWNIDPTTVQIPEGEAPSGATEGMNSAGMKGWTPPCPPADTGVHHYRFLLWALKEEIQVPDTVTHGQFEEAMKDIELARAELVGMYTTEHLPSENPTELV